MVKKVILAPKINVAKHFREISENWRKRAKSRKLFKTRKIEKRKKLRKTRFHKKKKKKLLGLQCCKMRVFERFFTHCEKCPFFTTEQLVIALFFHLVQQQKKTSGNCFIFENLRDISIPHGLEP